MNEYLRDCINGSSDSIIINEDVPYDISTANTITRTDYDLEVQIPTEREKILNDFDFFKHLSHSFYSDRFFNHRSYSLPTKPVFPEKISSLLDVKKSHTAIKEIINSSCPRPCDSSNSSSITNGRRILKEEYYFDRLKKKTAEIKKTENTCGLLSRRVTLHSVKAQVEKISAKTKGPSLVPKGKITWPKKVQEQQLDNKENNPLIPVIRLEKFFKRMNKSDVESTGVSSKEAPMGRDMNRLRLKERTERAPLLEQKCQNKSPIETKKFAKPVGTQRVNNSSANSLLKTTKSTNNAILKRKNLKC